MPRLIIFLLIVIAAVAGSVLLGKARSNPSPAKLAPKGSNTVDSVLSTLGTDVRQRLAQHFEAAGVSYPPTQVTFLAMKDTALLEVWAGPETNPVYIHTYPILALSGQAGPKLREGDRQVPEGTYTISGLNPNSSFHLSLKLNYPNQFDLKHAQAEGRSSPGSNIFIHGNTVSIGCLAMGDLVIEEIFVLAADVKRQNMQIVIAPTDPRLNTLSSTHPLPWVPDLFFMSVWHVGFNVLCGFRPNCPIGQFL